MKKTMRFYLALWGAKFIIAILSKMGKNATHVPGRKAINFCPDFLNQIDKPEHIIGITGTNGKTTVSNLIADVLEAQGYELVDNRFGGNIDSGMASALIKNTTWTGKMKKKYAVLEIDERMTTKIFPYIKPEILVCTNLFRDSYKRNAHVEFIFNILNQTIPAESTLILNAEDLVSSRLAKNNKRFYFGISSHEWNTGSMPSIINDMRACPECGATLQYEYVRYNHIGKAKCPDCHFESPEMDYYVKSMDQDKQQLVIGTPNGEYSVKLLGDNITDAYNTVTAIAALECFGILPEDIQAAFEKMHIPETRYGYIEKNNKKIITNVAKGQNPVACSRIFDFVKNEPGKKSVVLMIDDFYDRIDSTENIAWVFDADFEYLNDEHIKQIIVSGERNKDISLRLLMAGVPEDKIVMVEKETDAAQFVDLGSVDAVHILHDLFMTDYAHSARDYLLSQCSGN